MLLLSLPTDVSAGDTASTFSIDEQRHLTARFEAEELDILLRRLSITAGFALVVVGKLGKAPVQGFDGVLLPDAIRQLAGDHHLLMQFDEGPENGGAVTKVIVFSRHTTAQAQARQPQQETAASTDRVKAEIRYDDFASLDRTMRLEHVTALVDEAEPADNDLLKQILRVDSNHKVREKAALALSQFDDEHAEEALLAALDDPNRAVRAEALRGLRHVQGARSASILADVIQHDPDPMVRRIAIDIAARLRSPFIDTAIEDAATDQDPMVREVAEQALRRR